MGHKLTTEDRRKGALAAAAVKRERGKSIRERISDKLDEEADLVVQVYVDAMKAKRGKDADHPTRLRAVNDAIEQAHGRPTQAVTATVDINADLEHKGVSLEDVLRVARESGVVLPDTERGD